MEKSCKLGTICLRVITVLEPVEKSYSLTARFRSRAEMSVVVGKVGYPIKSCCIEAGPFQVCDVTPGSHALFSHLFCAPRDHWDLYGTANAPPKLGPMWVRLPHGFCVKRSKKFITNQGLLSQSGPWLLIASIFIELLCLDCYKKICYALVASYLVHPKSC